MLRRVLSKFPSYTYLKYGNIQNFSLRLSIIKTYSSHSSIKDAFDNTQMKIDQLNIFHSSDMLKSIETMKSFDEPLNKEIIDQMLLICHKAIEKELLHPSVAKETWSLLSANKNLNLDRLQFISLLQICAEENLKLDLDAVLHLLERYGVELDQQVCESLAKIFSENRDPEAFSNMASLMDQKNIAMNELIYSYLILITGLQGDMQEVNKLVSATYKNSMKLTSHTFTALIRVHIYNSMSSFEIKNIIGNFKKMSLEFSNKEFLSILLQALEQWQTSKDVTIFNDILKLQPECAPSFSIDGVVEKLIDLGFPNEALYLLKFCVDKEDQPPSLTQTSSACIKTLIQRDVDLDTAIGFCTEVKKIGINDWVFYIALAEALSSQKEELSLALLWHLHESGESLRNHYFWPLFSMSPSLGRCFYLFDKMKELDVSVSLETLTNYVVQHLPLKEWRDALQVMVKNGITQTSAGRALLYTFLQKRLFLLATEIIKELEIDFLCEEIIDKLANNFKSRPKKTLEILFDLLKKESDSRSDWVGMFLLSCLSNKSDIEVHKFEDMLEKMRVENLSISRKNLELLSEYQNGIYADILPKYFSKSGVALEISEMNPNVPLLHINSPKMSIDQLECHLEELKSKNMNTRGVLRKLLIGYSKNNIQGKLQSALEEFEDLRTKKSPGIMSLQFKNFVIKKDANAALDQLITIYELYPKFKLDSFKIIDLCTLLVSQSRAEEAYAVLKDYCSRYKIEAHYAKNVVRNCYELLLECKKNYDLDLIQKFLSLLLTSHLAEPSRIMLGVPLQCMLAKNDLVGTVEKSQEFYKTYETLSCRRQILIALIQEGIKNPGKTFTQNNSSEISIEGLIHQFFQLCIVDGDQLSAQFEFFMATVQTGHRKEAFKIAKLFSGVLRPKKLVEECRYLLKLEDEQSLLLLMSVSVFLKSFNRLHVCNTLLNLYIMKQEPKKAQKLLELMKKENITPSQVFTEKFQQYIQPSAAVVESPSSTDEL